MMHSGHSQFMTSQQRSERWLAVLPLVLRQPTSLRGQWIEVIEMAYEEFGDLTTTDWTLFGIGAGLLFIGIFLSGQKIENILGIWSRRNFVGFSVLAGIGTLGALLSVRLDEGMLTEWLGEGSVDWANTLGGLSALVWVAAIASAARISKDSMVPAVFGIIFAAVG